MAPDDEALADAIAARLAHRRSIKKNGEPWSEYFGKLITPGRLAWLVLFIVQGIQLAWGAGRQFRDVQIRLESSDQTAAIVKGLEDNTATQGALTAELRDTVDRLMQENDVLAKTTRGLNEQVRLTVTRGEFQRVVQLQLIPRLEKIEKAQATAATFSGEKP